VSLIDKISAIVGLYILNQKAELCESISKETNNVTRNLGFVHHGKSPAEVRVIV
jgi:hypothetical protein